ncbi:hypothetical protein ACHAPC_008747 [Botrytis cinerea]
MSRSGCDDDISQSVLFQLKALETDVVVIKGDVVKLDDVRVAFKRAIKPIAGIIQGVMLLRYKMFTFMSDTEFSEAIRPKQQGTWNLHNTAFQEGLVLDFFTMLSSICGVVGQTEQANYSASSSFLDTFSVYRQGLGLKACSIDLGVIEDVGYHESSSDVRVLFSLVKSKAKGDVVLSMTIEVINRQFTKSLNLSEPIEPTKPLSGYGIDIFVAVEFRNWVRVQLGAELTTLEVINAKTLAALGAGVVTKISI